jgi:DNA-binding transcriptional ArsR family regulator
MRPVTAGLRKRLFRPEAPLAIDNSTHTEILYLMVEYRSDLDLTFGALADPTRRAILATLSLGQASVTELARPHNMSLPAVLKHLQVLERAGLILQTKTGRVRQCRLAVEPMKQASDWLSHYRLFWEQQLDTLGRHLARQHPSEVFPWPQQQPRPK